MSSMPEIDECCSSPPSLKEKLKSSMCCFRAHDGQLSRPPLPYPNAPHSPRSPCAWLKSRAHELEIRDRCRGLIGTKGKNRRRHNPADFRYDPASYSLNFEDDNVNNFYDRRGGMKEEELPLYNFAARLPATPERPSAAEQWREDRGTVVAAPRSQLVA